MEDKNTFDKGEASPVLKAVGDVALDATNFPDDAFRTLIGTRFDNNQNAILEQAEINAIEIV